MTDEIRKWLGLDEPHCKNCIHVSYNPDSIGCKKLKIYELLDEVPCNSKYYKSKIKE